MSEEVKTASIRTDRIVFLRGQRVVLDEDLAAVYGVSTKRLNEQIRRNLERFPEDFLFQLSDQEVSDLRSQFATSKAGRGGRRYKPYAFTEHGAVMAANVLNSPNCHSSKRLGCSRIHQAARSIPRSSRVKTKASRN
jgi:hypothetical protein